MMSTSMKILILISVLSTVESRRQSFINFDSDVLLSPNESCVAVNNGESVNGLCTSIEKCPSILADVRAQKFDHTVCGFDGIIQIVCCITAQSELEPCRVPNTNQSGVMKKWSECETKVGTPCQGHECSGLVCCPVALKRKFKTNCRDFGIGNVDQVAGGIRVAPGEYTHMAALGYMSNGEILWNCGGSLINNRFVVTAAHCLTNRNTGPVQIVRLGALNLLNDSNSADCSEDFKVARLIPHPDYKSTYVYNDIGLIELAQQVEFNKYIQPICLPTSSDVVQLFKSMGWGATGHADDLSVHLLKIDQELFSYEECQSFYNVGRRFPNGIMNDTHICAGSRNSNQSTCQGDSGGPLLSERYVYGQKMLVIDGIVSFGSVCGFAESPGVYTKVFPYIEWIHQSVNGGMPYETPYHCTITERHFNTDVLLSEI